ncbi:MAG: 4-hydroxythreonine-4-phosphate dehydrogenase PdxA [Acidobacteria bacterium]|nr:4-hydroxythreonine-4-phosphate dehydrogenase PdxA [Acidobacteriota bacterium]
MRRVRVGITVGDPAGIGPEIAEKARQDARVQAVCEPVIFGPASLEGVRAGEESAAGGRAAYDTLVRAVEAAQRGEIDAIATAPLSKHAFALAGIPWKGHTDLLAHLCGVEHVRMLFYAAGTEVPALRTAVPAVRAAEGDGDGTERRGFSPGGHAPLCVTLVTVHVPLADVPRLISTPEVTRTIVMTADWLRALGTTAPRVALAGLNPHAGEAGLLGHEEDDVLRPAVAKARGQGVDASGPWPADTVFVRAARGEFDAVVACYHDQGLIPVKLLAFGEAVNVTIGLPIIRTSVDHGTAFDIAGRGVADPGSMVAAVRLAARLAEARA